MRNTTMISILIMVLFLVVYSEPNAVSAKDTITHDRGNGYQIVVGKSGDIIYEILLEDTPGQMVIVGKHAKTNSKISYITTGFSVSLNSVCTSGAVPYHIQGETEELKLLSEPDDSILGDNVVTTYRIDKNNLFEIITKMLFEKYNYDYKTLQKEFQKGITVYLNNIFAMCERTGGSGSVPDRIWGKYQTLSEIMEAPIKSGYGPWGARTQEVLPHYYGMKLYLKKNLFQLTIEYYDTVNHRVVGKEENHCIYEVGQTVAVKPQDIQNSNGSIVRFDGQEYSISGNSQLVYEGNGKSIEYSEYAPFIRFTEQANSVLRIPVMPIEKDCRVVLQYIDQDNNQLKMDMDGGGYDHGEKYSYPNVELLIEAINGEYYEYENQWIYRYTNVSGQIVKGEPQKGTPLFQRTDVKKDTAIYIALIYDKSQQEHFSEQQIEYMDAFATGVLKADERGAECFDAEEGIPTTEPMYANVFSSEYMLTIGFQRVTKESVIPIQVTKSYQLQWKQEKNEQGIPSKDNPIPTPIITYVDITETETVTKTVLVKRTYSYTKLAEIAYYQLKNAELSSAVLPDGQLLLQPQNYKVPVLNYIHYQTDSDRYALPKQVNTGIMLPTEVISSDSIIKPEVPDETALFTLEADNNCDEIMVRNDMLEFGGKLVLNHSYTEKNAPAAHLDYIAKPKLIGENVLYESNQIIPATLPNQSYQVNGKICYMAAVMFKTNKPQTIINSISGFHEIVVHTPVFLKAFLHNDNDQYVQLLSFDASSIPLVLDEEGISSDFVLELSNSGFHNERKGYKERDYAMNMGKNASYIARKNGIFRNEVCFPFDVYLDVQMDGNSENDQLITANNWYTIGVNKQRFYLPLYIKEGTYTVKARTIAVNGTDRINTSEYEKNASPEHYVAEDTIRVQVSGRIYGFTLYDIEDYPVWQSVFRMKNSMLLKRNTNARTGYHERNQFAQDKVYDYTVGIKDSYGRATTRSSQFTFPLVSGNHPFYINQGILKAGYTWRFFLHTCGEVMMWDKSSIRITPKFYHFNSQGKRMEEVDLYYSEMVNGQVKNLIRIGDEFDQRNKKNAVTGDVALGIPHHELRVTEQLRKANPSKWRSQISVMYHYGGIMSNTAFKTFTADDYANRVTDSKQESNFQQSKAAWEDITKRKQTYYFEYRLPENIQAVTKGYPVAVYAKKYGIYQQESFWKKDGYLLIQLEIIAYDSNGNPYLSYINQKNHDSFGHCSMWEMEGAPESKLDSHGIKYLLQPGDFLFIYMNQNSSDDYKASGIY